MYTKEISDQKVWDDFVTSLPSSFFQSWNWGEFQKKLGKKIVRLGFFDDKHDLFATAAGTIIEARRGKYLYVRNGPVLRWDNEEKNSFVIQQLKNKAESLGLWFVRISPFVEKQSKGADFITQRRFPISQMYDVDALDTWLLDLTQDKEEILSQMRKSTRYEIRKAEREGVEIIKSETLEFFDEFYDVYKATVSRQNWNGYSKKYIQKQYETFLGSDQASIFLAKYKDKFIAASIFIYYGDSSNYHYSGSLPENKVNGTPLIHWENMKYAKSRGLKIYNFWGIAPENKPNHPWRNLTFFKKGFGGYEQRWLETRDLVISPLYKLTEIIEWFDKKRKGY